MGWGWGVSAAVKRVTRGGGCIEEAMARIISSDEERERDDNPKPPSSLLLLTFLASSQPWMGKKAFGPCNAAAAAEGETRDTLRGEGGRPNKRAKKGEGERERIDQEATLS